MAEVDLDNAVQLINRILKEGLTDSFKKELGQEAVRIIVGRTRDGLGISRDVKENEKDSYKGLGFSKLNDLSREYVERRKALKKRNFKFGEFAKPSSKQSNLTFTGQMLDAVTYQTTSNGFIIKVSDTIRTDGKKNSDIAKWVEEQGRPFLGLAQTEFDTISELVVDRLRETARQVLRKGS